MAVIVSLQDMARSMQETFDEIEEDEEFESNDSLSAHSDFETEFFQDVKIISVRLFAIVSRKIVKAYNLPIGCCMVCVSHS
jgi:hypothetical protein